MTTDSNSHGRRWVSARSLAIAQEDTTSVPHSATLTHVVADGMRFLNSISNCRTSIPQIAPRTMQAIVTALARKVSCRILRQDTMRWNMQFPDRGSGFASTEMSAGVDFTRRALLFTGGRSSRRICPRMVSRSITATRMLRVATHLGQCSARKCRARHLVERFLKLTFECDISQVVSVRVRGRFQREWNPLRQPGLQLLTLRRHR